MKDVCIIGGGVIGLCSAYYLNKAGHRVTVIDAGSITDGCSFGNAGMIVPSHFIPLAAPGMIAKGVRWMFNSTSPFYVKPRISADLFRWGYHFYRSATASRVNRAIPVLKDLSLLSKNLYGQLKGELPFDFGYEQRGLLMLFREKETEREEGETVRIAREHGLEAQLLSPDEVQALEPEVEVRVRGGVYFPGDAHLVPQVFMVRLLTFLQERGVVFRKDTSVTGFSIKSNQVTELIIPGGVIPVDACVLAAGSWSGALAGKLSLNIPMQAGKGYSFTIAKPEQQVRIPSIFLEARVAVTPMGGLVRFGGTMEISGVDHSVDMNRVRGIVESIPRYYPKMKVERPNVANVWHGLRPCSPDGLPFIGRSQAMKNLVIATGHAMMGVSLGPATGKLVSEIVDEVPTTMDLELLDPARFQ